MFLDCDLVSPEKRKKKKLFTYCICQFTSFHFLNTVNGNKFDCAFFPAFINNCILPTPEFIIQDKVFHNVCKTSFWNNKMEFTVRNQDVSYFQCFAFKFKNIHVASTEWVKISLVEMMMGMNVAEQLKTDLMVIVKTNTYFSMNVNLEKPRHFIYGENVSGSTMKA